MYLSSIGLSCKFKSLHVSKKLSFKASAIHLRHDCLCYDSESFQPDALGRETFKQLNKTSICCRPREHLFLGDQQVKLFEKDHASLHLDSHCNSSLHHLFPFGKKFHWWERKTHFSMYWISWSKSKRSKFNSNKSQVPERHTGRAKWVRGDKKSMDNPQPVQFQNLGKFFITREHRVGFVWTAAFRGNRFTVTHRRKCLFLFPWWEIYVKLYEAVGLPKNVSSISNVNSFSAKWHWREDSVSLSDVPLIAKLLRNWAGLALVTDGLCCDWNAAKPPGTWRICFQTYPDVRSWLTDQFNEPDTNKTQLQTFRSWAEPQQRRSHLIEQGQSGGGSMPHLQKNKPPFCLFSFFTSLSPNLRGTCCVFGNGLMFHVSARKRISEILMTTQFWNSNKTMNQYKDEHAAWAPS